MATCANCEKETTNPKFCCKSCSAIFTNKSHPKRKLSKICSREGCCNIVKHYRTLLCEEHYQGSLAEQKEILLKTTIGEYRNRIKGSQKKYHMSSLNVAVRMLARSWHKELTTMPCNNCGYDKHVELCHIKGIATYPDTATMGEVNSKDNIIQLCPNCHWELDYGDLTIEDVKTTGLEPALLHYGATP